MLELSALRMQTAITFDVVAFTHLDDDLICGSANDADRVQSDSIVISEATNCEPREVPPSVSIERRDVVAPRPLQPGR